MQKTFTLIALLIIVGSAQRTIAAPRFYQDKDEWYQKMAEQRRFSIDTSAIAVVLYEKYSYDLQSEFTTSGAMIKNVHRIIKVVKQSGASYGDVTILVPGTPWNKVEIRGVKATTYNVEGGKLKKQSLSNDNIVKDKSDYLQQTRFSMPAVQPGSVLDITYTIESPLSFLFARCDFQHDIPTIYSEAETYIPNTIDFLAMDQGRGTMFTEFDDSRKSLKEEDIPESYTVTEALSGNDILHKRWIRRNIPPIIDEPFAPTAANFKECLQLRINGIHGMAFKHGIMENWDKVNRSLLESFHFYKPIETKHASIWNKTQELMAGRSDAESNARTIFAYVRNNMHASGYTDIYIGTDMEKLFAAHAASPSEINIILTTMMRYAGLESYPVLIPDHDDRGAVDAFPDMNQFSKTICEVSIGKEKYYLDASGSNNSFGILPAEDCKGYARVIAPPKGRSVSLDINALKERQLVTVSTDNTDIKNYTVKVACQFSNQLAAKQRSSWRADSTKIKKYVQASLARLGMDASLQRYTISGLDNPDTSLVLQYFVRINWPQSNTVYFNPHFFSYFNENPFKAAHRDLPVAMPGVLDAYYNLQLQLPAGYKLDESPKPAIVTLNDADSYKYLVDYDATSSTLKLNSRIHLERTWYPTDTYDLMKQFFDKIIESQQKTYVFKKS